MGKSKSSKPQVTNRRFWLLRNVDVSGISGVGYIAEGFECTDGTVFLKWLTPTSSIGIYENIRAMTQVHGHEGSTEVVWEEQ